MSSVACHRPSSTPLPWSANNRQHSEHIGCQTPVRADNSATKIRGKVRAGLPPLFRLRSLRPLRSGKSASNAAGELHTLARQTTGFAQVERPSRLKVAGSRKDGRRRDLPNIYERSIRITISLIGHEAHYEACPRLKRTVTCLSKAPEG